MEYKSLDKNRGVAGLNMFIEIIAILFVIGILVMAFLLAGTGLRDSTYVAKAAQIHNETITLLNGTGNSTSVAHLRDVSLSSVVMTVNESTVPSANYTVDGGVVTGTSLSQLAENSRVVNLTFAYSHQADSSATRSINDTTNALSSVTDWFATFITLSAIIVLVLLVVLIIRTVKGGNAFGGA